MTQALLACAPFATLLSRLPAITPLLEPSKCPALHGLALFAAELAAASPVPASASGAGSGSAAAGGQGPAEAGNAGQGPAAAGGSGQQQQDAPSGVADGWADVPVSGARTVQHPAVHALRFPAMDLLPATSSPWTHAVDPHAVDPSCG